MIIDTNFKVYSDANGGDPDKTSPTLRKYHRLLWSKPLPIGTRLELQENIGKIYLYHKSEAGEFSLGSDGIAHPYHNRVEKNDPKKPVIDKIPENLLAEFIDNCSTIGGYTIFPNKRIDGCWTINQARGCLRYSIDDRFDLTLECIRRHYLGIENPLRKTLMKYDHFFKLFIDFDGYVNFFLLNDLIDSNQAVRFYLPFDDFRTSPGFSGVNEYLLYKERVTDFVNSRNDRIKKFCMDKD